MKLLSNFIIAGAALTQLVFTPGSACAQSEPYALSASRVTLNGYDLLTDSYNSGDPNHSTEGLYDPTKAGGLGNVWSDAGILNSVGVGNVSIWGRLTAGVSYGLEIGPESSIGSVPWHESGNLGIEPGALVITMTAWQFNNVDLPPALWQQPAGGTLDGQSYTYLLPTGNYKLSSLNLAGNEKLLVTGAARLYVSDELNLKGNAAIQIRPGAGLTLYVGAGTANIRGTGVLNEGPPAQFIYYGLGANNTLNMRLTTPFSGLIYAPRAVCYISAKGNTPAEMNGSFVVQEVDLSSVLRLHYDEALSVQ